MCIWVVYCGFVFILHPDHPLWTIFLSCESPLSWPSATLDLCLSFNICKLTDSTWVSDCLWKPPDLSLHPFWSCNPVSQLLIVETVRKFLCISKSLYRYWKPCLSYPLLESSLQLLEGLWVDFCPLWLLYGFALKISAWGINYVVKLLHTLVLPLI